MIWVAHAQKLELPVPSISRSLLSRLEAHDWPGNVRELMNSLETAMILGRGDGLELPDEFSRRAKRELASSPLRFESAVRVAIEEALAQREARSTARMAQRHGSGSNRARFKARCGSWASSETTSCSPRTNLPTEEHSRSKIRSVPGRAYSKG